MSPAAADLSDATSSGNSPKAGNRCGCLISIQATIRSPTRFESTVPETKAILEGGALLGSDYVAKKFVAGIANHKKAIAVGSGARFLLLAIRYCPFLWDAYSRYKIRLARKARSADTADDDSATTESDASKP